MNPALALLQLDSVAAGIEAGDAMVKRAPLQQLLAGTVQPGHFVILASGDTASVEEALRAADEAAGGAILDRVFLPDIHPAVVEALRGVRTTGDVESLGVVETTAAAGAIAAADAGVKGALVEVLEVNLSDGLGGKGYVLFGGGVSDVEAAVEEAAAAAGAGLLHRAVVSQLHPEMAANLAASPRFAPLVGRE